MKSNIVCIKYFFPLFMAFEMIASNDHSMRKIWKKWSIELLAANAEHDERETRSIIFVFGADMTMLYNISLVHGLFAKFVFDCDCVND